MPVASLAQPAARSEGEVRPLHIVPPFELSSNDDAIVRVVGAVSCSGTLIDEDLVLTAHHCVSARNERGQVQKRDIDPETIDVELGGDHLPWGEVKVRAIVSPDCGYTKGEGDLAILVLSRRLIGIPTLAARIARAPSQGEAIAPVGFGRCAQSRDPLRRKERAGSNLERVGRGTFVTPASICPGDSGGPAISTKTGEVIGVISASIMDGDETTVGPSVFTRVDVWSQLFAAAREIADGASPSELPPFRACAN